MGIKKRIRCYAQRLKKDFLETKADIPATKEGLETSESVSEDKLCLFMQKIITKIVIIFQIKDPIWYLKKIP